MGHAISTNQKDWQVLPPLGQITDDFGQLEVFQYEVIDGVPTVIFCCGWRELSERRLSSFGKRDATYSLPVGENLTDIDYSRAVRF
jgi:beta-fructofuranosidase